MNFFSKSNRIARWVATGVLLAGLVLSTAATGSAETILNAGLEKLRQRCLEILNTAFQSEEAFIRSGAVRAAGESENPEVLPLLLKGMTDFFPTTRQFALQGLLHVSVEQAVQAAFKALDDSNVWVRATALEIVGERGSRDMMPAVRRLMEIPDPMVRLGASYALYRLGEADELDQILKAVESGDAIGRYQAITYLGKIDIPRTRERLVRLLDENEEDEILIYVLKALEKQVEIEQLSRLEKLLQHQNPRVRKQAVLAMGNLPAQAALSRVTPFCVDEDPLVQVVAAWAVARMESPQCDGIFSMAVRHADYGVRSVAARVLGEIDRPDSFQLLTYGLNDTNSRVRTAAVRATGKLGGAQSFPLLLQMLEDSATAIRAYAAGYLLKILRPPGAQPKPKASRENSATGSAAHP